MKRHSEAVEAHLETLRAGLRRLLRRVEPIRPLGAWSRELGRDSRYLARALSGQRSMPWVEETAALLVLTGTDARAFFWELFPRGGELERALIATQNPQVPGLGLEDLWEEMAARRPPPEPKEMVRRARELLERYLAMARVCDTEALSREVFGSEGGLRFALSGRSRLSFEGVFGLLEALGREPWRFFVDLLGPEDDTLAPGITWWSLLDALDGIDRGGVEGLAAERERRGLHPPSELAAAKTRNDEP